MESPVKFSFPNKDQVARGTAVNLLYRFGMQTAKPLRISDQIGANGNPEFTELKDLEGRPWLTSLAIEADGKRFEFAECIIAINQEKNIVTTALQGLEGTIKEYISKGDYSITVDAGINNYKEGDETGASLEYPEQQVTELVKILDLEEALAVQSDFLQMFNVKSVVVTTYDLQQETHSNRQGISINMLSDKPYLIRLKEEQDSVKA